MCDEDSTLDTTDFTDSPPTLYREIGDTTARHDTPPPRLPARPQDTVVYYFMDNQTEPYQTRIPVPPHKFTLSHLKCALNRTNFKCHIKRMDPAVGAEVKAEIFEDDQVIEPNSQGQFIFYLLTTDENQHGTLRRKNNKKHAPVTHKPSVLSTRKQNPAAMSRQPSVQRHRRPKLDFVEETVDESSSDSDSCNVTSISEQTGRRQPQPGQQQQQRRMRRPRQRRHWSPSFLSTTMETDMSVSLNLITVPLNLNPDLPFGMNVVLRESGGNQMLSVSSISPGGIVALDGRIREGHIIIEVNGTPLSNFSGDQAVKFLKESVERAAKTRGQLKLTCVEPIDREFFVPPDQSVQPIDTAEWVRHTMYATGIVPHANNHIFSIESTSEFKAPPGTWPSSGVGSSIVSSVPGKQFTMQSAAPLLLRALLDPRHGCPRRHEPHSSLNIRDCFLGIDLINWLSDNVVGIDDFDTGARFAESLIAARYLVQVNHSGAFDRAGYLTVNWDKLPRNEHNTLRRGMVDVMDGKPSLDDTMLGRRKGKGCFHGLICIASHDKTASKRKR